MNKTSKTDKNEDVENQRFSGCPRQRRESKILEFPKIKDFRQSLSNFVIQKIPKGFFWEIGELQNLVENTKKSNISCVQRIYEILDEIKNSNILVIVEGKKDKIALQKLGVINIVELNKKPIFQIVEDVANSNEECIILTDLDKKGKEIYGKLNSNLQKNGVKINNKFREFLFKNTNLRQIEGLTTYLGTF